MAINSGQTLPERMEKHANKNWVSLSFNHKTTLTMGALVPMAVKELYPGEFCKVKMEVMMRFAPLFLPIMHQCYFTVDWFYVRTGSLFQNNYASAFESFIMQHPVTGSIGWSFFTYLRADAVFTDGVLNYMGFNAPPASGTLISGTPVSAIPPAAYYQIWRWMYRNPNIQTDEWTNLEPGNMAAQITQMLPDLRVKRRNWPRDYYTVATPEPQFGANVLIPSYEGQMDAYSGLTGLPFGFQHILEADTGLIVESGSLNAGTGGALVNSTVNDEVVLRLSSTIRDFRYAAQMCEFLERATRAGGDSDTTPRWNDFVKRHFDWNPNPLMIDMPVWIGGYTGDVIISDVMATAQGEATVVGDYAGKAIVRDNTPEFSYQAPDYGVIIPILTVYPKASYYSGIDKIWTRDHKMKYMWEQFALIGDQPLLNKEVWFSWYDADVAWNEEIFGYIPQYNWERFSNDIVSGQMRTLWESFHLGRKFVAASEVVLNSDFITCTPDIGRVFDVDYDNGEHECYVHAYLKIDILRRLPRFGIPAL